MRSCPECGTQYEDHVETCLVDGTDLESIHSGALPPVVVPSGKNSTWVLLLGAAGAVLVVIVGVVILGLLTVPQAPVATAPVPVAPTPVPVSAPVPPAAPAAPVPAVAPTVQLAIVSTPLGARVMENDIFVCMTPCNVEHPPHAPMPRTFILTLEDHQPSTLLVDQPGGPFVVVLEPIAKASRPRPQTTPRPPPTPVPAPSGPRPTISRDR